MPLIDLKSMSGDQLQEEARQWSLEPSNYSSKSELIKAIESQREMRASRHGIDQADVDSGMASDPDVPGRQETGVGSVKPEDDKPRKAVADLKDPDIIDSVQEATVTRPTPGEPENTNKKAEDAQTKMEARDTAVGKPEPESPDK